MVFNESVMYKDTLKDSGAGADKSVEELQVEVKLQRRFDEYMLSNGFKRSSYDICIYYRSYAPGEYIYLLLYVDDMLIAYKSKAEIGSTKSLLKREFDMKDLGEANKILGMEIVRDRSRKILRVSQSGPDIAYAVSIVSRYLANPGKNHWEAVKWILKYLRGTVNVGLIYETNRGNHKDIIGFVDSDYAKDPDKGGVYGPYGGCQGSYLAKGTLGRVRCGT
nr:retrovirus-related Pol polyprotein from transposon TNT 1-94 [Tanacetum cinerariifolium]